jgi:(p)ppGpp synthase/HD superfamily hydrolase
MTSEDLQLRSWAHRRGPHATRAIAQALALAEEVHRGQVRRSGDPYIVHPVAVALILAEHGADLATVIAGLLHDFSDTTHAPPITLLRDKFGDDVADLVIQAMALDRAPADLDVLEAADHRAIALKVVDRLHNMRTIRFLDVAKRRKKANQTLRLVAPLARSVGLTAIGAELEQLAIATLRRENPTNAEQHGPLRARRGSGLATCRGLLRVGALILPADCRTRWLQDWDGELHALEGRRERLSFAVDVLFGLPQMAVLTRRSEQS